MAQKVSTKVKDADGYHYEYVVTDNQGTVFYSGDSETKANAALKEAREWENTPDADDANNSTDNTNTTSSDSSGGTANGGSGSKEAETAAYNSPMIEPAPPWTPMIEKIPPETKIALVLNQEPPNSFTTGKPKEYKGNDSASPKEGGPDYPPAMESISSMAGIGVAVAAMADNAGGIANAAGDIAAAATAAIAEKAAAIMAEYSAKMIALPASIPGRIAEYTADRFNKTKDDLNEFGEAFTPVKVSLSDIIDELTKDSDQVVEEANKKIDEEKKNKAIERAQKTTKKFTDSVNKIAAKSNEVIGKIMTHTLEGVEWIQKNLDKESQRVEKNIRQELETGYLQVEKSIDEFCKSEGDKLGTNLVREYNNLIKKQAKETIDKKRKLETDAKIKVNQLMQKAKLQIFAMLGL